MPVAVLARYPHQTTRPPAPTARHQTRRWHLPVLPHSYRTSRDRRRPPPYRTHHHPSSRLTILLTSCKHLARKLLIKELGRAAPYGVYDLAANAGRVSVGVNHDTVAFAVNIISQWWRNLATSLPQRDPAADDRRWRRQQWLAGQAVEARVAEAGQRTRPRRRGQPLAARHQQVEQNRAPPLSFISQNWRAQPPVS